MFYSETKGCWIERVETADGRYKELSSKDKAKLKRKVREFYQQEDDGPSFEEIADGYEASLESRVEDKTAQSYAPHIRRAKEYFQGRYIKDISADEVQSYVDYIGALYSKETTHRALVVINRIFKYAIKRQGSGLKYNPCVAVEIPKGLPKTRREPPTPEQLAKITPEGFGLFAWFIMYSGLRDGELLALRWEDIDREAGVIHVTKTATYTGNKAVIKHRTKTEAGIRDVPLLAPLEAALPEGGKGFVFGGDEPLTHTMFYKRWLSWCREVGLAEPITERHRGKNGHVYTCTRWKATVTPYQFRHEFASLLQDAEVSEFDAMKAMGHSSIRVTKDIYTHLRERKQKNSLADKVNSYLSGVRVDQS